jgi:hypothetical protein
VLKVTIALFHSHRQGASNITLSIAPENYVVPQQGVDGNWTWALLVSDGGAETVLGNGLLTNYFTVFDASTRVMSFATQTGLGCDECLSLTARS